MGTKRIVVTAKDQGKILDLGGICCWEEVEVYIGRDWLEIHLGDNVYLFGEGIFGRGKLLETPSDTYDQMLIWDVEGTGWTGFML